MRLLLIGDVVGKPGVAILTKALRGLRKREEIDFVAANGENASGGSGLTPSLYRELIASGVDCVTLGDHAFRRKEIFGLLNSENRVVRPANFPEAAPGRGHTVIAAKNKIPVAVVTLVGRVFMSPVDCPFRAADQILDALPNDVKVILVDFHAEATSDMQLMGRHLDGRASAVLGTHTHVPTADERVLPRGTAFQCDVGMTGSQESILGRRIDRVLQTTRTFRPTHFEVATEDPRIQGTLVDVDESTGRATAIRRVEIDAEEAESLANHNG